MKNNYKIVVLLSLIMLCHAAYAQQKKPSPADSLQFAELATDYNNVINNEPAKGDSIAAVYFAKAAKLNNNDYMGRGATLISTAKVSLNKIADAEEWYKKGQYYFSKAENFLWKGYSSLNMGKILSRNYDFDKGFSYLIQSVEDFEKAKDYNMVTQAYCNISNLFHDSKNYSKGIEYANLALKTVAGNDSIKDNSRWAAWNVLAINYDDNNEYAKAIAAHLKALPFAGNRAHSTYNNLGNTYRKTGNTDSALYYLDKSLESLQTNPPGWGMEYNFATVYGNMADVMRMQKKYPQASAYVDSAMLYAQKSESPEKLMDASEFAYRLKKETGQYEAALGFLEKFVSLKDSLLNEEKTATILTLQEKYETVKKQKIIEQQKFEIARKNQWLWLAGAGLLLLAICGYFAYRINKSRQEKKLQQQIFARQEAETKALFDGEQNERIRIARDLHDGVGQMLSLVKMNLSMLQNNDAALQKAITLTDKTIDEVRNVSHNLIPQELNFGILKALKNMAEKINESGSTKMEVDIPESLEGLQFEKQNELSIYRIVQEVVNNMIKHAGASLIRLSMHTGGNQVFISVKDNGRGMNVKDMEQSKGIGWKNINARVHMLDGKINVQSEKFSGTQIEITLPANGIQ